jgi:hypothetical protein
MAPPPPLLVPPTDARSLALAWRPDGREALELGPFDQGGVVERVEWCLAAAGGKRVAVPCSECDYGFRLPEGGEGPLECRAGPQPAADATCERCSLSALTPQVLVPCASCVDFGFDAAAGRCACNALPRS